MSNVIKSNEQFFNENILKSGEGWVRLPNGLIIQWGFRNMTANSTATETLPIPFTTANYFAIAQGYENSTAADPAQVYAKSNTTISIVNGAGTTINVHYMAIGY